MQVHQPIVEVGVFGCVGGPVRGRVVFLEDALLFADVGWVARQMVLGAPGGVVPAFVVEIARVDAVDVFQVRRQLPIGNVIAPRGGLGFRVCGGGLLGHALFHKREGIFSRMRARRSGLFWRRLFG